MANRAVFLDRDGTMAKDVHYCSHPQDFELFPSTAKAVRLLNEHGFKVIVVTNQSGIARGYFTEETLAEIHQKMKEELAKEGAWVDAVYYCPHHPMITATAASQSLSWFFKPPRIMILTLSNPS